MSERCECVSGYESCCDPFIEAAIARFGITRDHRRAGYILPDGRMLDFDMRGMGIRTEDHLALLDVEGDEEGEIEDLCREHRIIRCRACFGVEIFAMPTERQWGTIEKIVRQCFERDSLVGVYHVEFMYGTSEHPKVDGTVVDKPRDLARAKRMVAEAYEGEQERP